LFKEFLKEYKIIGLTIAFIIGSALTTLVQSLVNDVMMPFLSLLLPKGDWQSATLQLGPVIIKCGSFLAALINFIIIALVVFLISKKVLKEEKVTKNNL
jgi:large conductance mechanosensitive channel